DDAFMLAEYTAGLINNLSGFNNARTQTADDASVIAIRHEAYILTVWFCSNRQIETLGQCTHFCLRQLAEREAQKIKLRTRGSKKEVALVAGGISRAMQFGSLLALCAAGIMASRKSIGA